MDLSTTDQPNNSAEFIQWMVLDRFVFNADEDQGRERLSKTFWGRAMTSLKEYFDIQLLPAVPPAVSRLFVRYVSSEGMSMEVVTADHDLLLLRATTSTDFDTVPYRHDYFVFRPSGSQVTPLPACTEPIVLPLEDGEVTMRRMFHNNTLGLVSFISSEEEFEFAVVQLAKFVDIPGGSSKNGAEICVFRSSMSDKWEIQTLPIHQKEEEFSDLQGWSTDGAIILDGTICWFDYYHGGILLHRGERFLQYARLPINNRPTNSLPSDKKLEMYRSLSVTGERGSEMLQFVDVARDDDDFYGPLGNGYTFTITCYAFNPVDLTWKIYARTSSDELIRRGAHNVMPRNSVPTFPVVSRNDPRFIHFLMSEPMDGIDKVSAVVIDVSNQIIVSVTTYIEGDQERSAVSVKWVRHRSRLPWSFLSFQPYHPKAARAAGSWTRGRPWPLEGIDQGEPLF